MKRKNDSSNAEEEQSREHSTVSKDFLQSWSHQHCVPHHTDRFRRTESLETDLGDYFQMIFDRGIKAI